MDKYFEVGQIVNTNGLKGMLKIKPFTDDVKEFEEFKSIYIQKKAELVEFKIQMVRYVKNMVLLKLEGIDDIDEAEKYRNMIRNYIDPQIRKYNSLISSCNSFKSS